MKSRSWVVGAGLVVGLVVSGAGCLQVIGYKDAVLASDDGGTDDGGPDAPVATCFDDVKNGNETDKDCGGGTCAPCPDGDRCQVGADCQSKSCMGGICLAPTCSDHVQNGAETDVDCGGGACSSCKVGQVCAVGSDCETSYCNGKLCASTYVWADHFDGAALSSLAVDPAGRISLAGNVTGTSDFGGGPLMNTGGSLAGDVFVARFDTAGKYLWAQKFVGTGLQVANGVAIDSADSTVIAGTFNNSLQIGSGLTASGFSDAFLTKLDPTGMTVWANHYGASGAALTANGVAVDDLQRSVVAGGLSGSVDMGGGLLTSAGGQDVLVAKFVDDGSLMWSKRFGGAGDQTATAVAVDGQQNVILAGNIFSGSINFGGDDLADQGSGDIFVAKLDKLGAHVWSKRFGDADKQVATAIAVDASGNVIVAGSFQGTIDFGGQPLTASGSGKHAFVAKLGADGKYIWSKKFDDSVYLRIATVALDAAGNVFGTGQFGSHVDFGGGAIKTAGSGNGAFIFKMDPSGEHPWSRGFSDASNGNSGGVAVSASSGNTIVFGGYFGGSIDFGGGTMTSLGSSAMFLAKFNTP